MVNDFRFQYSYSAYLFGPSGEPIFTDLGQYPASRLALLQPVYSFPSFRYGQGYGEFGIETRWEVKDDFNLVRGAHSLKWGFDFSHVPFADDTVAELSGHLDFHHGPGLQPRGSIHDRQPQEPGAVHRRDSRIVHLGARLAVLGLRPG